jgi:dTDP-4-dehydrorhamnose reductase
MKILITGASGQLGQDLQKECRRRGIDYVATDLQRNDAGHGESNTQSSGFASNQEPGTGNLEQSLESSGNQEPGTCNRSHCDPNCEPPATGHVLHLDITDFRTVPKILTETKPDVIINCAAYNAVDKAEEDWKAAFMVNSLGPRNLAIISEELKIPLVHFSTDAVFDGKKGTPYTIWDQPNPLSKYGHSKLLGERLITQVCSRSFIVRLSWVFGKGNVNFVRKVIQWSAGTRELKGAYDQTSCPSYTVDLAKAIIDLLNTGAYGLYHITNTGFASKFELAEETLRLIGWPGKILPVKSSEFESAAQRPEFSAMDSFPLKETIGYELPHWKDALSRFLQESGVINSQK